MLSLLPLHCTIALSSANLILNTPATLSGHIAFREWPYCVADAIVHLYMFDSAKVLSYRKLSQNMRGKQA